ncbi:MAG: RNA-binding S4 domain-containing protein [Desulfocapsaceae bacterium]|jgi:ribosome-associated protein|nr:RNA-binding S4 domain-containing protein [Desulfocapsaceae bacterium]
MKTVPVVVSRFPIRLGQFLKHASIVSDGVQGKSLISDGEVRVNGALEYRRGKQLNSGDVVTVGTTSYICSSRPA